MVLYNLYNWIHALNFEIITDNKNKINVLLNIWTNFGESQAIINLEGNNF
jgi:hypothetical protein